MGRWRLHICLCRIPTHPDPLKLFPKYQAGVEEPQRQKGRETQPEQLNKAERRDSCSQLLKYKPVYKELCLQ